MSPDTKAPSALRKEMFIAMRELLGSGYVREYYEESASPFIAIAQTHIAELVEALEAVRENGCGCMSNKEEVRHSFHCVIPKVESALRCFKEGL